MKKATLFLVLLFTTCILYSQNCNQLPIRFSSYIEAINKVKEASFNIEDNVDCSRSSWISKASYHNCNGEKGFFILTTKKGNEYIHQDVPINIWKQFKNASSFGTYYNEYLKGKYTLRIK